MRVDTLTVGMFQSNCFVVSCEDTREAIVIDPGEEGDLDRLDISVDVLETPEEVSGPEDLDPKQYGVVVRTIDGRRGLLLPDLEGVETVDQQLRIACRKGGIDPVADHYSIFRFKVQRHH